MRKLLTIAAMAAGLAVMTGKAHAYTVPANPVDIEVFAQMAQNLQITISTATLYDFGQFTPNQHKNTGTVFVDIQNTGGGLTQTYEMRVNNTANWTAHTAAGDPGVIDTFALDAIFNSAAVVDGDFNDVNDRLTTAFTAADGTRFAGNQTGVNQPFGSSVQLRLRFVAPPTSSVATRQRAQVDINAVTP